jgi:aspartate-semialdehyde dehydrogenase
VGTSIKIPVGILGATGSVGQKFVELLSTHPWFELTALAASERSSGKKYKEVVQWFSSTPLPQAAAELMVQGCLPTLPCRVVFSGLDATVAGEIETRFAKAGYVVISNSKNHRMDPDVPLLVPEINADQLELVKTQPYGKGMIVTNPNCSTIGLVLALKPIIDRFGLEAVSVVTLQALSGAGYPGVASLDMLDNVIPFIGGEEEKMEQEPKKIFGLPRLPVSATCTRVPVMDGHTECVSVRLTRHASPQELIEAWRTFTGEPQRLNLPSAPRQPLHYLDDERFPQPRHDRDLERGMGVAIGRLRPCPVLDYKFVLLSHNTIRGAAGGTILIAELMKEKGWLV